MSTEPAVLLKRSDGPFYRVHIGQDYEAAAKLLSTQQAFTVCPILIGPSSSLDAANLVSKAIQALCKPLKNNWFEAPSANIAATILLQALSSTPEPEADNRQDSSEEGLLGPSPNCTEPTQKEVDNEEAEAPNCTGETESCHTGDTDATLSPLSPPSPLSPLSPLWNYVAPCIAKDASRAAEIRRILIQELGKTEGKRILSYCMATVAKDSHGQKNRVLKANGTLLKVKH